MSNFWQDTITAARHFRQELHRYPELGWEETRTAKRIRDLLTELKIPWEPCAETGTLARLNPDSSGKHIALRGDIDALPIEEENDCDWRSHHGGCMHACGHDGHTATLYAAARWLKHCEATLPGPVTLVFQPAEEGLHGAREMIRQGALEGIDEIYGWHNWPAIPFGQLACPDGIVMCGNGTFTLTFEGRGGHASQPELCADPVLAASATHLALQQIVARRLPPQSAAVVSVTSIEAPSSPTVIPQKAVMGGSIRVPDRQTREKINHLIGDIARSTANSYGVECAVDIQPRYEATINHPDAAGRVRNLWRDEFGDDGLNATLPVPIMASEDFSYYLQEIPGAFALVGADDGDNHHAPCHSPHYDFNDRLIPLVTRLYARLAGTPAP
ncbi:MAG: peptidase M20 [Porticoccaceae bacterium]|nr:peptidase M20 [Porticoccaceae bacterium]